MPNQLRVVGVRYTALQSSAVLRSSPGLEELYVQGCRLLSDLSPLAGKPHLRILDACGASVYSVSALEHCTALEEFFFYCCDAPAGLSALNDFGLRSKLNVGCTSVCDLCPFGDLANSLEKQQLENCRRLTSVEALHFCAKLRTTSITNAAVADMRPLAECAALEELRMDQCRELAPIAALQGLRFLRPLRIAQTDMVDLSPLADCTHLHRLQATGSSKLCLLEALRGKDELLVALLGDTAVTQLDPLASYTALTTLELNACSVLNVMAPWEALAACTQLICLPLSGCRMLTDASTLQSLSRVTHPDRSRTAVAHLDGLSRMAALQEIAVDDCKNVSLLPQLVTARSLRKLTADRSSVASVDNMGCCGAFSEVSFRDCKEVRSLAGLAEAPKLRTICASGSNVANVVFLHAFPEQEMVDFTACEKLHLSEGLAGGAAAAHACCLVQQGQLARELLVVPLAQGGPLRLLSPPRGPLEALTLAKAARHLCLLQCGALLCRPKLRPDA